MTQGALIGGGRMTPTSPKACDCGCGRRFVPPPSAPHKRFASERCRNRFHSQRRLAALEALALQQTPQPGARK